MKKNITKEFEDFVLKRLEHDAILSIWWMSDFYADCCDVLGIDGNEINKSSNKIRRRLLSMKKKGLIDSRRTGTGYLGKTDFGHSSSNTYTKKGFWDN